VLVARLGEIETEIAIGIRRRATAALDEYHLRREARTPDAGEGLEFHDQGQHVDLF
jgi:hypothetical protein